MLLAGVLLAGCGDSQETKPVTPPPKPKVESSASVDSLLGNAPPPSPAAAPRPAPVGTNKPVAPQMSVAAIEAKEYENWEQSSRKADWEKMLQLYVGDNKGRFPESIEELAKAFGRPLPPLPPGAVLMIDRTNKTVRMKRY